LTASADRRALSDDACASARRSPLRSARRKPHDGDVMHRYRSPSMNLVTLQALPR